MLLRRTHNEVEPLKDDLKEDYFYALLEHGIQTDEELHLFIWAFTGYSVPRHAVCPHHVAPFSFLADQYFDRVKSVLGFANRTGGKTVDVAMLNVVEALTKPGIEILSSAAVKSQADRGYEYVRQMIMGSRLIAEQVVSSLRSETRFYNGSMLALTTGSYGGLNSGHPNKFRCDEIELMYWNVLQEGLQMSVEKNGWPAGDCLTSTRKISSGTMQKLLDMAEEKQIAVYVWCIFEILERCTRKCHGDPVYGDCPAYSYRDKDGKERPMCGGKAHDLPPGGFYKIDDFVKKVALLDRDTWETQWLNLRPSSGALVYGEYFKDETPFLVPTEEAQELLARAREEAWTRVVGIDFGSNFYAGYLMQDPRTMIWYEYAEYWFSSDHDLPLSEHAKNVKAKDTLGWNNRTLVFADPSGRQAIRDLEGYGVYALQANNDVYSGVNHMKKLLQIRPDGLPGLRFFPSCQRIRKELGELYIHKLDKSGEPLKDVVMKRDDHAADASRYALFSYETVGTGRYRMRKLRGVF